jgi:hypothetical protein
MFDTRNPDAGVFRRRSVNDRRPSRRQPRRRVDEDGVVGDGLALNLTLGEDVWRTVIPFRRPPWKVLEGVTELVVESVLDKMLQIFLRP